MKWHVSLLLTGAAIIILNLGASAMAAEKVVVVPLVRTVQEHDDDLIPENIRYNTEILGVIGNYPDPSCMITEIALCENWCMSYYGVPDDYIPCMQGCVTMKLLYENACL